MNNEYLSLYIHIPFCLKRCDYCDYITYAGLESFIPSYIEALSEEIKEASSFFAKKAKITTIFFGGGTPTILSPNDLEILFMLIKEDFIIADDAEISIEANPGTITNEYLEKVKNFGINRISLGFQSTDDKELLLLGRLHNRQKAFDSIKLARDAGFTNINIDLIYGIPDQTIENWKTTLGETLELDVEHISLYSLTLEPETLMFKKVMNGELKMIDVDLAADMYEYARDKLSKNNFEHYEISNWAKKGYECNHNKQYWYANNYIGLGVGAHSHYCNFRYSNYSQLDIYIDQLLSQPPIKYLQEYKFPITNSTSESKYLSKMERMQEEMMLGLRLTKEGVSAQIFREKFDEDMMQIFSKEISELLGSNLANWDNQRLILTERGQLLGNQAFMKFVD